MESYESPKPLAQRCDSCGAPLEGSECVYCGTLYGVIKTSIEEKRLTKYGSYTKKTTVVKKSNAHLTSRKNGILSVSAIMFVAIVFISPHMRAILNTPSAGGSVAQGGGEASCSANPNIQYANDFSGGAPTSDSTTFVNSNSLTAVDAEVSRYSTHASADSLGTLPECWPEFMVRYEYHEGSDLLYTGTSATDSVMHVTAVGDTASYRDLRLYPTHVDCSGTVFNSHGEQTNTGNILLGVGEVCSGHPSDTLDLGPGGIFGTILGRVSQGVFIRFEMQVHRPHTDSLTLLNAFAINELTGDTILSPATMNFSDATPLADSLPHTVSLSGYDIDNMGTWSFGGSFAAMAEPAGAIKWIGGMAWLVGPESVGPYSPDERTVN